MKCSLKAFDGVALAMLAGALLLSACGGPEPAGEEQAAPQPVVQEDSTPTAPALVPLPGKEGTVPELVDKVTVLMRTGTGDVTIEVYPQAAPNAAARFLELVSAGFYDNTPVFRVVPGFVAQFGINWRDDFPAWQENTFDDDPVLFAHEPGTLAFAKAGPDTNSTQVFINYAENNRLASPDLNFTVFAKVVDGMEAVEAFVPVGDPSGGLDQGRLWEDGGNYLESLDMKPVMIEQMSIIESTAF